MARAADDAARDGSGLASRLAKVLGATDGAAAAAIARAGSLSALLAADDLQLRMIGLEDAARHQLMRVRELMIEAFREPLRDSIAFDDGDALACFLDARLRRLRIETFLTLYVDAGFRLIGEETASAGSARTVAICPATILRRALELRAAGLLIVHNHPSGSIAPSEADVRETDRLRIAAKAMEIDLVDHIIVTDHAHFSFRAGGLL